METFVAKVRFGSGPIFDPLMEEKGGWISREVHVSHEEMMEAVIESMAQDRKQEMKGMLNPFKEHPGEILPKDVEWDYSKFLVRKKMISFKVHSDKLINRIALVKDQILIEKFMGTNQIREL